MRDSEKLMESQHTEVATGRTYEALVEAFEHELGYLDPQIFLECPLLALSGHRC